MKRNPELTVACRCNKYTHSHYCLSWVSQKNSEFTIKKTHTCPVNLDVARDVSIISKAKSKALLSPLISARIVVEKEVIVEFHKDPFRNPVVAKIIRAVQRAKQPKNSKNSANLYFEWRNYYCNNFVIHIPICYLSVRLNSFNATSS